jgi:4-hydroxy-2-oxoheptanedioate aldolase
MRTNTVRQTMLAGQPTIGAMVGLGSPLAAQILSQAGFDHVLVDCQHGVWDGDSAMTAFHQIALGEAIPLARAAQNDFYAIGSLLDRGALGIVVPLVNSAQDAQSAVRAMRYPPRGDRSLAILAGRLHGADYMRAANDEVLLAVQIETAQAVERAEEIMAVEGVDACWIGPGDLAASMGVDVTTPQGAQEHAEAILKVRDACRATGKVPGICAVGDAQRWLDEGFLFVTAASDYGYLLTAAPQTVKVLRGEG